MRSENDQRICQVLIGYRICQVLIIGQKICQVLIGHMVREFVRFDWLENLPNIFHTSCIPESFFTAVKLSGNIYPRGVALLTI